MLDDANFYTVLKNKKTQFFKDFKFNENLKIFLLTITGFCLCSNNAKNVFPLLFSNSTTGIFN